MVRKDPLQAAFDSETSGAGRPRQSAPMKARRKAQRLAPPWERTAGDEGAADREEDARRRDTRRIAAQLSTGTAGRRAGEDVRATYDMFTVASTRVQMMGYNEDTEIVRVIFRDGTPWEYFDVTPQEWEGFKTAESPGQYINAVLNEKPYGRGSF